MSALALIRLGSRGLGAWSQAGLLQKAQPSLSALVQAKGLKVTPVQKGRVYGPEADNEKEVGTKHWVNERVIAVALLPIIPVALAFPNAVLDNVLVASVMLHTHWRLSGVVGDYIHGPIMPKICKPAVLVVSICALGGLLYFNYTDIGFANAVRMIYTEL
ncbi:hypothetical protein CAPTEDRAFT_158925 [Capitella teleta]|uniref:Succinate dehydrogenase [ubiquinone] cytochrome b small subunit n=1 Tax=Capitella teleta TaxID=283909 RepID=R7TLQ8_CAPTE|nr:hypothetical protein CAPTEDRAFT_158925 [Capitella teleta]|eukprot:ELT94758.1 hypothetical protein CAPTEDRAFT_158925 [Capitella teleta]